jgi:hypothetical protein
MWDLKKIFQLPKASSIQETDEIPVSQGEQTGHTKTITFAILKANIMNAVSDLIGNITQGPQGVQGAPGAKGDPGEKGEKGDKGDKGDTGLKGDQGNQGPEGIQGPIGEKGDTGDQGATGSQGLQGDKGDQGDQGDSGLSAYEIAVIEGFTGTESEWLESLKGEKGDQGDQGEPGEIGTTIEAYISDTDLINAIKTANYINGEATIAVVGKTVYQGQNYYESNIKYEAVADNQVIKYPFSKEIKLVPGTSYTIVQDDVYKILHFTAATEVTITTTAGLAANSRFEGGQLGNGQLSFNSLGATVVTAASELPKTAEKYGVFALDYISADTFLLFGKLELA